MARGACISCKFWEVNKGTELMGVCHRYPPVYTGRGDDGDAMERPDVFAFDQPATMASEWCGEFQERPVEAGKQAVQ